MSWRGRRHQRAWAVSFNPDRPGAGAGGRSRRPGSSAIGFDPARGAGRLSARHRASGSPEGACGSRSPAPRARSSNAIAAERLPAMYRATVVSMSAGTGAEPSGTLERADWSRLAASLHRPVSSPSTRFTAEVKRRASSATRTRSSADRRHWLPSRTCLGPDRSSARNASRFFQRVCLMARVPTRRRHPAAEQGRCHWFRRTRLWRSRRALNAGPRTGVSFDRIAPMRPIARWLTQRDSGGQPRSAYVAFLLHHK